MSFSTYIAKRYFFSRSTRNAVNVISGISIFGILVGTLALVVVMSAFNGLESLVKGFYNTFDPDLKVSLNEGKYFLQEAIPLQEIENTEGVEAVSLILEERVLLAYRDKEYIASIKGVSASYSEVTRIAEAITHGEDLMNSEGLPRAVLGAGVTYYLGYGRVAFQEPVQVFVPRKNASASNFNNAFSSELIYPSGVFSVQPEFDEKYMLASLSFVQKLLDQPNGLTSLEVKVEEGADLNRVKSELKTLLGSSFKVQDRDEQQAVFLKVMKTEGLFTFLVFALILAIASFTIMGSLSMMMLDKKDHLRTLWALGTEVKALQTIFFKEGMLISFVGAGLGLVVGVILVLAQQYFGLLEIGESYVVNSYPVELKWSDVGLVLVTVAAICGIASWLTSRRLTDKFLREVAV